MTTSRLNYKPDLISMKSICPLPAIPKNFNKSFEQICIERAEFIWKQQAHREAVSVFWSGGIDSTAALVALVKTKPSHQSINVYCNLNSILENSYFYTLLLKEKNVKLYNSSLFQNLKSTTVITGELGDQIFGSDLLFRIVALLGFDNLFADYRLVIPQLFASRAGTDYSNFLYERYLPIIKECPFEVKTAFDFIWWWNFTQKWQCVKYRMNSLVHPELDLMHFFEADDFQLWSLFNHDKKISDSVESYKMPSKQFIFSFDGNDDYKINKRKFGSPFGNKRHFYSLLEDGTKITTWIDCYNLIEKNRLI